MTTVNLTQSATVELDASGNGTAQMGPLSAREVWQPGVVHVQVATNTLEAVCAIYVGDEPIQRNFRDSTFTGSSGDSSENVSSDQVKCGDYLWAVWTGGDPFSQATLSVTGSKTV